MCLDHNTLVTIAGMDLIKVVILTFCLCLSLAQHHDENKGLEEHMNYHAPVHYTFMYKVHDPHTGDEKAQHETRDGDFVKGYYMLREPDGSIREVHYTSDKHIGFNAIVKRYFPHDMPDQKRQ